MPSDEREGQVLAALARPIEAFRSALATTIERLRAEAESTVLPDAASDGADLGRFALGRIDLDGFEAVAARQRVAVAPRAGPPIEEAYRVLGDLAAQKERLLCVDVEPGTSLVQAVASALARIGRAFGAARVVDLGRTGRYRAEEHAGLVTAFPFGRWGRSERRLAPPIVVSVDATDARAEGLAEFLDGSVKIVLLLRGDGPPAPLARLLTPGVYVAQVADAKELAGLCAAEGPAVAALVPEGGARFVHDPAAGATIAERLYVAHLPSTAPDRPAGTWSVFQQTEPLRQLSALLATASAPAAGAGAARGHDDAVGKLAAWLMVQADLKDLD